MPPKKKPVLASAPPSVWVVALMVVVGAVCTANLPDAESYEAAATVEALTSSPHFTKKNLAMLRAIAATVIFGAQAILFFGPGWDEDITYPPNSKLTECTIRIKRFGTLMFFTVWSWLILGLFFASTAYLGWIGGDQVDSSILRAILILWEIAAPNALLVTVVVTYVIWPEMKAKGCSEGLAVPIVLMQHNLNTLLVVSNAFSSNTPLLASHAAVSPIFGLCYVMFSWSMASSIAPQHGAVYLYFFFDSTQGVKFGLLAHVGLLAVLALFYALMVGLGAALAAAQVAGIPTGAQGVVLCLAACALCRFRD